MDILFQDIRLTFLWAEALPGLLEGSAKPASVLAFLGSRELYTSHFDGLLQGTPDPYGLEPPWSSPEGNFFWTFYLEGTVPGEISGERAWKNLVPLRKKSPVLVEAPWLPEKGKILVESFIHPHGIAVAVSVRIHETLTIEEAVEKAHGLRRTKELEASWINTQTQETLGLDALARKVLADLRRSVLGQDTAGGAPPTPFTIATIVQAEGADASAATPERGEIHRALQALTTWSPTWRDDALKTFGEARLFVRRNPPSHVLYASQRGRAVWFPGLHRPTKVHLRSLSCYHRNLLFTSLQVESLAALAMATDDVLDRNEIPPVRHAEHARQAVGILGRLYGADPSTYRSRSPRAQMDQNGCVEPINRVRDYFAMKPLK